MAKGKDAKKSEKKKPQKTAKEKKLAKRMKRDGKEYNWIITKQKLHFLNQIRNINNPIYKGPVLWTKVHVGWENVLEHDWGHDKRFDIPDISHMVWPMYWTKIEWPWMNNI